MKVDGVELIVQCLTSAWACRQCTVDVFEQRNDPQSCNFVAYGDTCAKSPVCGSMILVLIVNESIFSPRGFIRASARPLPPPSESHSNSTQGPGPFPGRSGVAARLSGDSDARQIQVCSGWPAGSGERRSHGQAPAFESESRDMEKQGKPALFTLAAGLRTARERRQPSPPPAHARDGTTACARMRAPAIARRTAGRARLTTPQPRPRRD